MARVIHGVASAVPVARHADPLTDLNRLLNRLQQTILRADAEREARLRASEFEREKAQTNIRYAQSLLTKLEQEALGVKIHARRQELQSDLNRKREALEQLVDRLSDLAEIAAADDGDGGDELDGGSGDTSEGEDILAEIIATPSESLDSSRSPDVAPESQPDDNESLLSQPLASSPPRPQQAPQPALGEKPATPASAKPPTTITTTTATTTTQTLRPRRADTFSEKEKGKDSHSIALFGDRAMTAHAPSATAEAILDHQRAEQDLLSESILQLAGDLKASSHAFSASLEEDREVVDRAGAGMGKAGEGMQAVTRRMGTLQRLTEGEGWWGRMRLYAQVYGLMVLLVLVVFVLPKLRF